MTAPGQHLSAAEIEIAYRHRDATLRACDQADAEERMIDYIPLVWPTVEPARPFVRGWAIDAIVEHLEAVSRGEIRRLMINVPPGFMKSLCTSVFWPSWEWGPRNLPSNRYICASYSQHLTVRDNVKTRKIINSQVYQDLWGDRFSLQGDQNAKEKFENDRTGFKIATSVHGVGTGERGDRVIIDDPHNVLESESDAIRNNALQWFAEVMPTRVNDAKTAVFVVIMQRVHENDVAGMIMEKELGYTILCVPMHHDPNHPHLSKGDKYVGWRGDPRKFLDELAFPERYGEAEIAEMTKAMMAWGGEYAVAGQLEQRPEPRGGGMVKEDWFEIVDAPPTGPRDRCRGWDFASTEGGDGAGSASVLTSEVHLKDGSTELYVEDVWFGRVSPGDLYERIRLTLAEDGYDVFQSLPQDPGQAGVYQVNDLLEMFSGYDFEFSLESGDKVVRFRPWAAQAATRAKVFRKIKLVRADWNRPYLDQITKFPVGRLKDIPDAQSRSYGGIAKRGGGHFLVGGSTLIAPTNHQAGTN